MTRIKRGGAAAVHTLYYRPASFLGFQRHYNFPLFVVFAGAMLGFSLARLYYLDISGHWQHGAAPGEYYWYQNPRGQYHIGITIHLATILPTGILTFAQFIPAVRRRWMLLHRVNGWLIVLLVYVANVGAVMIGRQVFGGDLATQGAFGLLVVLSSFGLAMAVWNVKRLQVDEHRKWMLRVMGWMGSIITMRMIMAITARIITRIGTYYVRMTCGEVQYIWRNNLARFEERYPSCNGTQGNVVVNANWGTRPDEIGASLRLSFGMAAWLAIFLHMVGVEFYLNMTPRESQRLRQVSYEKQLAAGYQNPGSAGLVLDRWADADPWLPRGQHVIGEGDRSVEASKATIEMQSLVSTEALETPQSAYRG